MITANDDKPAAASGAGTSATMSARRGQLSASKQALLEQRLRGKMNGKANGNANGGASANGAGADAASGTTSPGTAAPGTIPRTTLPGPAPLSFAQQRLWFLDQLAPGNPFYNIASAVRMQVALDVDVFHRALGEILRRHESLRTAFRAGDGGPVQVIDDDAALDLPVIDLQDRAPDERDAEALRLATEEAQRPFDLSRPPLVRTTLLRLGPTEWVFLLTMHHIVSDGWSMGVFSDELTALYLSFANGRPSPLPELTLQYRDFSVWQRERFAGGERQRHLEYWRRQLADLPVLSLPTDRPRPDTATFRGRYHAVALPATLTASLQDLSRKTGCTLFMTLLAGFQAVLARYSGQDDIVVGTPIANRTRTELEGLIGFFVNSLVVRTPVRAEMTFRELLAAVQQVCLDAYAHQDLPFDMLVEELQPQRDISRNPLFQVTFQLVNTPGVDQAKHGRAALLLDVKRRTAIFDLAFSLYETNGRLEGGIEFTTECFDEETVDRLFHCFRTLLEAAVVDPDRPLSALPLLSPEAAAGVIQLGQGPRRAYPVDEPLHAAIDAQAARTPEAVAVAADDRTLTYGDLQAEANRLAHHLIAQGAGRGQRIAVCLERSADLAVALLAALKTGACYVPLDPHYPAERLRYMLDDAKPAIVITRSALAARGAGSDAAVCLIDEVRKELRAALSVNPGCDVRPEDPAYMIYTSGSTGGPKGVLVPHRAIANHMHWMLETFGFRASDRVLQRTPVSFDASVWEFWAPLMSGGRLVMAPADKHVDAAALVDTILRHRITIVQLVPALLRLLLAEPRVSTCLSLRRVFCGGDALSRDLLDLCASRLGVELCNLYGPTEVTIDATFWRANEAAERAFVPIGRPIANLHAYVVEPNGQPAPIGVPGELWLGGAGVALGYFRREELTAERFVRDPFAKPAGTDATRPPLVVYRTGDRVRWLADGTLEFFGRLDHQVKIRGVRVEPGDVESALRTHPAVKDVAVVSARDPIGDACLVAYVVASPDVKPPTEDAHREFVAQWQGVYDEVFAPSATPPATSPAPASMSSNGHASNGHGSNGHAPAPNEPDDPTFNTSGWISSFTGAPIPASQMRVWLDTTTGRLQRRPVKRMLEIGCGTGMILFRLAPGCDEYLGLDFAEGALRYVSRHVARLGLEHVRLERRLADDLGDLPARHYDLVALNSVVQYFPGMEYLLRVIDSAIEATAPGGRVFLGDIRSLPLLEAFHMAVEMWLAGPTEPAAHVRRRVRRRVRQEKEQAIDPAFFAALPQRCPRISGVRIELKRGREWNELVQFRYDVTLEIDGTRLDDEARGGTGTRIVDWTRDALSIDRLDALLDAAGPVMVTGIPNARTAGELAAVADTASATVGELRSVQQQAAGQAIDPEAVWAIGERTRRAVHVGWAADDPEQLAAGRFDCLFGAAGEPETSSGLYMRSRQPARAWTGYANSPLQASLTQNLVPLLRSHLEARLPDAMVPSSFVWLDEMPLAPNGKVDRRALPSLDAARSRLVQVYVPPRTPVEEQLAGIWSQLLGAVQVGVHDNFFDLGGHSLLAALLASRIRQTFEIELPLIRVFEAPTIAGLAALIRPDEASAPGSASGSAGLPAPARIEPRREAPDTAAEIDTMSDGDVDAMLASLLAERGGAE